MASMTLKRPVRPRALISLVPMIDVMLILLIFFMVTSTYLNLDMIPAVRQQQGGTAGPEASTGASAPVMIRLGADGIPVVQGRSMEAVGLAVLLQQRLAADPLTRVLILPSGGATTQALVSVMDVAARAGAVRLRVIRLEGR